MTESIQYHPSKIDEIPCQEISDPAVLSKNPLVSVKMTTYNHEPYIAQAIEGVVKQKTIFPIELIIGEDCSADGTMGIVLKYQKKYPDIIRVITSDRNVGMKENSYRTMKACRGKYIAFCEGDDYWHNPEKLQKQVDYMETNPECGMIFADCNVYYTRSQKTISNFNANKGFLSTTNLNIEQILWGGLVKFTCTILARKNIVEDVVEADFYLHRDRVFLMGDEQLAAEVSLKSKVVYIPECLSTYRVLDESASKSKDPKRVFRFNISAAEMRLYICNKHNISENYRKRTELDWCRNSLRLAFFEKNIDLAMEVKKKQTFTWKEWLRYLGVKYSTIHYGYRLASLVFSLFRKKNFQWP